MTAQHVIEWLGLEPLPDEGGWFRQTWRSPEYVAAGVLGPRYRRECLVGTAIYYLVTDSVNGFSALHRLPTDEIYHFYLGDPVEQLRLHPDGRSEWIVLGADLRAGQHVQHVAPRDVWQATRLVAGGRWALLGTTLAPGFDFSDYEPGSRSALIAAYPDVAAAIVSFTRE